MKLCLVFTYFNRVTEFYVAYYIDLCLFMFIFLVKRQLLNFQSSTTGLFPQMTQETEIASIRDSIYCAVAVWSLYQAYK